MQLPRVPTPGIALLLVCAACAAPKEAPPELLLVEQEAFTGTVLTGPLVEVEPQAVDWTQAWALELALAYLYTLPAAEEAVEGKLVVVEGTGELFETRAELAGGFLIGAEGDAAPRVEPSWQQRFVQILPPGATVLLATQLNPAVEEGPQASWRSFSLELSRSAVDPERVEAALVIEGLARLRGEVDPRDPQAIVERAGEPVELRERILLNRPPAPDGEPLRLLVPAPRRTAPSGGFVVDLRLSRHPETALDAVTLAQARERTQRQLHASHKRVLERTSGLGLGEGFRFESESALQALRRRALRRPALVFLADSTGAALTEELALIAQPESLGELLAALVTQDEATRPPQGARAFGWFLEHRSLAWLLDRAEDEERVLEPELRAVLLRHAGEMGRYPDLLRDALAGCSNTVELGEALLRENRIFLEDAHPAARVRAFDWLAERGAAPGGYDPLAPLDERRAALARMEQEMEAREAGEEDS